MITARYSFDVKMGNPRDAETAKNGTKLLRGANFRGLLSGVPIAGALSWSILCDGISAADRRSYHPTFESGRTRRPLPDRSLPGDWQWATGRSMILAESKVPTPFLELLSRL